MDQIHFAFFGDCFVGISSLLLFILGVVFSPELLELPPLRSSGVHRMVYIVHVNPVHFQCFILDV